MAEFGRKEISLAEDEMPGLMSTRKKYGPQQPLKGVRITGSLHMTIQTAVLIETLQSLGASVRYKKKKKKKKFLTDKILDGLLATFFPPKITQQLHVLQMEHQSLHGRERP